MNFIKKKWMIPVATMIVIAIAVTGYFLFRPDHSLQFKRDQQSTKKTTEFDGLEIKIPGSDDNGYWELKLARLTGLDDVGRMSTIQGRYIVDNRPTQFITADRGKIFWADRRVTFEKHVIFKTIQDQSLTADMLTWDPNRRIIRAKGNVILQTQGISVKTEQLTAATDIKKATFSGMTQVIAQR